VLRRDADAELHIWIRFQGTDQRRHFDRLWARTDHQQYMEYWLHIVYSGSVYSSRIFFVTEPAFADNNLRHTPILGV
jgi:hypothetical protein